MDRDKIIELQNKIVEGLKLSVKKMIQQKQKDHLPLAYSNEKGEIIIVHSMDLKL
ncbi:MAG: hypothetical protein RL329_420 [Bacteroidota bacterium]|jgi:hypothetical protein